MSRLDDSRATSRTEYEDDRDMVHFWDAAKPRSEPLKQRWYVPALILFIVISVPWYRPAGQIGRIVAGLPIWIWISLGCTFAVSCLTAAAILWCWRDDED